MDLSELNTTEFAEEGAWMEIRHPDTDDVLFEQDEGGTRRPWRIRLRGSDSKTANSAAHRQANRRLQNATSRKGIKITSEGLESDELAVLIDLTIGWENIINNGAELEFTRENVSMVYREFKWIREQAQAFVDNRGNFSPTSLKS